MEDVDENIMNAAHNLFVILDERDIMEEFTDEYENDQTINIVEFIKEHSGVDITKRVYDLIFELYAEIIPPERIKGKIK